VINLKRDFCRTVENDKFYGGITDNICNIVIMKIMECYQFTYIFLCKTDRDISFFIEGRIYEKNINVNIINVIFDKFF
jgi:hypothetical protein